MDEDEPRKKPNYEIGQMLDPLSVDELEEVVSVLSQEIERLKAEIDRKKSDLSAAESLFKT